MSGDMIVCYCTSKTKEYVEKRIAEMVDEKSEFSTDLVSQVHASFSEGDASTGRCFGCFDEVEEMIFERIRTLKK